MDAAVDDKQEVEKCRICLTELTNKAAVNKCKHEFCYECLLEWSKVIIPLLFGIKILIYYQISVFTKHYIEGYSWVSRGIYIDINLFKNKKSSCNGILSIG